jgi:hypothetical protein
MNQPANTQRNVFSDCINGHELEFILYAQGRVYIDRVGEEHTILVCVNGETVELARVWFIQEPIGPSMLEFIPLAGDSDIRFYFERKKLPVNTSRLFEGKLKLQIIYTGCVLTSVLIKNED